MIPVPTRVPFAKKQIKRLVAFDGGMNSKFSAQVIGDNELQDIRNFNFDEKGALRKRKGYLKHYTSTFASSAARDAYNYRKQDGTSRLVIAAGDSLYSDKPQFVQLYDLQSDWETSGVQISGVSTVVTAGDITLQPYGMLGQFLIGAASALLGGNSGVTRTGTWRSQTIDISAVSDKTSGKIAISQTSPATTTILVQTRASTDGSSWGAWTNLGGSNAIVSAAQSFLQVLVTMTSTTATVSPSVQSLQVTYDTTATVTVIASSLSTVGRYTFTTQNDVLYIVNGQDANRKWDATTFAVQGGTPPTGKYVMVHKNIMFIAGNSTNPSRLYFSSLADPETWPALNFIDVGKGDGDTISGLAILLDRLVITKQNSVWLLEGDASSNFVLRRATDEAGCVDQHSIVVVHNTLGMMARDGFYFFDGVRMVLASEKIQPTIAALNTAQFGLVTSVYFPSIRKVFIALPSSGMLSNDTILVFDALRTAWTVYTGINAACFVIWRKFTVDYLLFGSAATGQMFDMETGYSDDGAAIAAYVVTKSLDLGGAEIEKLASAVYADAKETSLTGNATLNISFFKDLSTTETAATAVTVTSSQINVGRVIPSSVSAGTVRELAVKIAESSSTRSLTVMGLTVEFTPKQGLRST